MFLLSVTRNSVARGIHAPAVREWPVGDRIVTAVTDGWLSSSVHRDGRIAVREGAPFAPGDDALVFATASYCERDGSIEVHKSLLGGRQVYVHAAPDGSFYCASHARLLRMAGVRLQDDPERMPELFMFRYVSPPRTLFKGVEQLLAGQRLRFEPDREGWRQARSELYSPPRVDPAARRSGRDSYGEYGDRTRDALRDTVAALAPTKESLHVLASGGLDSSILFKLAHDKFGISQSHSTSYPFESEDDDIEKHYALSAAEAFGARHNFFVPTTRQFLRGVIESVSAAEEPVVHTQSVLMMLLFRDGLPAGEGTAVVGQGADGLYGLRLHGTVGAVDRFRRSHPRLSPMLRPGLWAAAKPVLRFPPVSVAARWGLRRMRRDSGVVDVMHLRWGPRVPLTDPNHALWALGVTGEAWWTRRRFGATHADTIAGRAAAIEAFADRHVLDQLSLLDFLSDVSVTQAIWSKFGEAARKVVYYPFNARPLMDRAFETPWDLKLAEPKGLLRDAARKIGVPEFIISRKKANFNVHPARWALRGATFEPLVPLAAKVFDERDVRRMQSPRWRAAYTFWTMVNYAIWKRLFIDGESTGTLIEELERSAAEALPDGEPVVA